MVSGEQVGTNGFLRLIWCNMEYDMVLVPISKALMGSSGLSKPLCNDCRTPDCTNPIRERSVSVRGLVIKMRLWVSNNVVRQVVSCKGYVGKTDVAISSDETNDC